MQHPVELTHQFPAADAREGQCTPSDSQCGDQGGPVRSVSGDIPDQDVDDPIRCLHDIVEVAAQQRVLATRPVAGNDLDARVVQQ